MPLQLVEQKRLYRQIADQLAHLIARGEFPAGARLPAERELAASFGVSRASVREAIISLEMSGLVEVRVGTGIFVMPQTRAVEGPKDAGPGPFELLAARKLVEGEIAALAARNATSEHALALRRSVERLEARVDDFVAREAEDRDFHLLLAKSTRNGSLELVVQGLWNQRAELWGRLQRHFHTDDLARRTIRDHAAIAAAVEARDADAARAAMHRHLARVMREFQRNVDAGAAEAAPPIRNPSSRRRKVAPA